jgi:hypothetical protein
MNGVCNDDAVPGRVSAWGGRTFCRLGAWEERWCRGGWDGPVRVLAPSRRARESRWHCCCVAPRCREESGRVELRRRGMEPGGVIVKRVTLQMFHLSTRDRRLARDPCLVQVVRRRIAVCGGGGLAGGAARPLKPTQTDPESRVFRSGTARPQHLPCHGDAPPTFRGPADALPHSSCGQSPGSSA